MNTRRLTLSTALLGAVSLSLLPVGSTQAQTTATTVPVGYQQVTVAAATDASTPVSTVIATPFYQSAAFAGPITSVDSSSAISSSAAGFTAGQFTSDPTKPYLLHFKSGTAVGRYFLITANTATQLTVANRGLDLTTLSAAADTFEVLPAFTLNTLFPTTGTPFQTGSSATAADNILLWNGSTWDTFYNNGTNWRKTGNLGNQNNVILYPDEGFFVTRRATTAATFTFLGTVPATTEVSDLPGPASTFVANRFPVDTTLLSVGFQNLPNWLSGASATAADNVYIWNGTTWGVYYYNGTTWRKTGNLGNQNTQPIPSGIAMFVVRQSTVSGPSAALTQALPYTLN